MSGIDESTPMFNSLGVRPRRATALPSAAIIAPLSVQKRIGGMRTSIPASAHLAVAASRSWLFALNPPPITRVATP